MNDQSSVQMVTRDLWFGSRSTRAVSLTLAVLLAVLVSRPEPVDAQVFFAPPTAVSVGINFEPSLATDGAGNWVLAWDRTPDDYLSPSRHPNSIEISRSADNGATWSAADTLAAAAFAPQVATDRVGTWITVWLDGSGIEMARSSDNGRTWTTPVALAAGDQPQIASDGMGRWVVMWSTSSRPREIGDIVTVRSSDNGVTWTVPTPLDASGGAQGSNGRIATDRAGAWVAVWDRGFWPNAADVWFARSTDAGGTWTTPALLSNDAGMLWEFQPRLATDTKGNWLVAWREIHTWMPDLAPGTDQDILAVRSSDNGVTWSTPAFLNTNAATDSIDQEDNSPSLATDGNGVWLATWEWQGTFDRQACYHAVVAQSTDNGTSWTPPALINPNQDFVKNMEQEPEVVSDGAGHWVVAWSLDAPNTMVAAHGSTCGNGIVEFGKQCDDGNRIDGDGCSSSCQNEMLAGDSLVLKGGIGSKLQLASRDPAIALGRGDLSSDDPVLHGATVRVFSTAGDGVDLSYDLPADRWQYVGGAGRNLGYRYQRRSGAIATAAVTPGHLMKLTLRDQQLARLLAQNPNPVQVVLTMGTKVYQLSFGGTVTFHAQRLFRSRSAPAPLVSP